MSVGHTDGKKGRSWWFVIDLPRGPDGRRRQLRRRGYRTRAAAEKARLRALLDLEQGQRPHSLTVADLLDRWLRDYAEPRLALRTLVGYRMIVRVHLRPALGHLRLDDLSAAHLQTYYRQTYRADGQGGPLSPATIRQHARLLRQVLAQAVRWRLITHNPADEAHPPQVPRKELVVPEPTDLWTFVESLRGTAYHLPAALALLAGLRRGETLGLRWEDLDLERRELVVRRALVTGPGSQPLEKSPKSGRSRRIAMPAALVVILAAVPRRSAWVVCRQDGSPYAPDSWTSGWRKVAERRCRRLGLPVLAFHDLRHAHASLLGLADVSLKVVSERLGHARIGITADLYQHLLPGMDRAAAEGIERVLGQGKGEE